MLRRLVLLLVLVAAVAVWAVASTLLNDRPAIDALPYIVASVAFGVGVGIGLYGAVVGPAASAALAFGLLVVLLVVDESGMAVTGSLGETLAYANAMAALAVQVGAVCLFAGTPGRSRTVGWFALGAAAVAVTVLMRSSAGTAGGVVLLGAGAWALFTRDPKGRWAAVTAGLVLMGAAVVQVVFTALDSWPSDWDDALSSRRIDLWTDAWSIATANPWLGQGVGSFVDLSPTAADPDTTAAHSMVMQVVAELGWIGVALLVAVVVAGLVLLQSTPPRVRLIAVAAWFAVWAQGLVDYVMDFPVVVFAVGASIGVALWSGQPTVSSGQPTVTSRAPA